MKINISNILKATRSPQEPTWNPVTTLIQACAQTRRMKSELHTLEKVLTQRASLARSAMADQTKTLHTLVSMLKVAQGDEERRRIAQLIAEGGTHENIDLAHILSGSAIDP